MTLIPDEEMRKQGQINLAPMVDFLFLIVAVFAILAVTRSSLHDANIDLVKIESPLDAHMEEKEIYIVDLTITRDGKYRWLTEEGDYLSPSPERIRDELRRQKNSGLLPMNSSDTKVLLHIDQNASWNTVASLIVAVREAGFQVHPVYELD